MWTGGLIDWVILCWATSLPQRSSICSGGFSGPEKRSDGGANHDESGLKSLRRQGVDVSVIGRIVW